MGWTIRGHCFGAATFPSLPLTCQCYEVLSNLVLAVKLLRQVVRYGYDAGLVVFAQRFGVLHTVLKL